MERGKRGVEKIGGNPVVEVLKLYKDGKKESNNLGVSER